MATPEKKNVPLIDPQVRMGHVHLKVANLERALGFYRDVLGFELMQRMGDQAAFLSAGGYHHHIALNTWESLDGTPPPFGTTGLYHHAIVASRFTCAILMAMAWNYIAIDQEKPGHIRRMGSWRCIHDTWISERCWESCLLRSRLSCRRRRIYSYAGISRRFAQMNADQKS
jgi:Glyoxalase/Bleomycin resistance protein/Dioxygenase superfamily